MPDWMNPQLEWFLFGLACIVAELVLPGFVIIFFGVGAWVTAIALWLGLIERFDAQLAVFILSTVLSLVLFRKKGMQAFGGKVSGELKSGEELDDLRGARAIATTEIVPGRLDGKVEFRGSLWLAESETTITSGSVVEIISRDNLTLKVKPL